MFKINILLVLLIIFTGFVKGDDNVRKVKVTSSSSVSVDADYADVSIRIYVEGMDFDANSKKILKIISDIEKSLLSYEIKEGSFAKPLIENGFEKSFLKSSSTKLFGSSSSSEENGYSCCTIVISVLKIENLGFINKEITNIKEASITNTQLKLNNEESIKLAQYKKALLSAKRKGELMASTLDAKLGAPLLIEELNVVRGVPEESVNRILIKSNSKDGYSKITIQVNVYVEFQLN